MPTGRVGASTLRSRLTEGRCSSCSADSVVTVAEPTVPSSSGLGHHPLKVETRVRTPLGLQAKVQVKGHVQVEHRVSWAVRPAFVPRTTTTRHDRTCREGRPGRVGCRLLRLPPPLRSPAKLRAIRLRGARPC